MSGDFSLQACKQNVQSCFSRLIGESSKYAAQQQHADHQGNEAFTCFIHWVKK